MGVSGAHVAFPDPRIYAPVASGEPRAQWYALAEAALDASTGIASDAADAALTDALRVALARDAASVEHAVENAPSPFVARRLWRAADEISRSCAEGDALAVTLFALPLVMVVGANANAEDAAVPGIIPNARRLADVLRAGSALRANETIALSDVLASASALSIRSLPAWQAVRRSAVHLNEPPAAPAPIALTRHESVHLRFLIGTAVAGRGVNLLEDRSVGAWGAGLTRELVRALSSERCPVLPLPRAPQAPLVARHDGLVAQREIAAQLFASNAIRNVRASSGEPTAVISAHRASDAPGGGELRLSLSSPFEPRDAEGFRCPIYPIEPVSAALSMLLDLLHDCRVTDVRLVAGVHPDRLAGIDVPLFLKPETIPEGELLQ